MKKHLLLIFFLILTVFTLPAQSPRNSISVSSGPSFPIGKYASTSETGKYSGYAKPGISLDISYNHKLKNNFGLELMLYAQQNGSNTRVREDQLSKTGLFYDRLEDVVVIYDHWSIPNKKRFTGSLMAGISKELILTPESGKFSLSPKVLVGIAYTHTPKIIAKSRMENAYAELLQSKTDGFGPALMASSSLNYHLSSNIRLNLHIQYFTIQKATTRNVEVVALGTSGGLVIPNLYQISNSVRLPFSTSVQTDIKQQVNGINAKLGVSFGI